MGVLNVTPDSFSDGGLHLDPTAALGRARLMVAEGAAVIDVGGESTRPGAQPVGVDVELSRVVPVVEALVAQLGGAQLGGGGPGRGRPGVGGMDGTVRVSVDTRNADVAAAAVAAGASLINDVSATLWPVAAELGVGWVAMHGCTDPRTMQDAPAYDDVVAEVCEFLLDRAARALAAGVPEVWIDPGIGFSKTITHNLDLLANLDVLVATGHRVLVGTSRKSTLGALVAAADRVAGPVPTGDRLEASVATAVWAFDQGVHMVRVHDVLPTVQAGRVVLGTMGD